MPFIDPQKTNVECSSVERQFGVVVEALEAVWIALRAGYVAAKDGVELEDVVGREVGELAVLQVIPQVFDGVEFGSIRRESFQPQPGIVMQHLPNRVALVHGTAVPDHGHRAAQMAEKIAEEVGGPLGVDELLRVAPPIQPEATATRRDRQCGGDRNPVVMRSLDLQNRSLPARRQRASHQRRHQEAAFVDQDDIRTPTPRTFFIRGHSSRSQRRTSRSFRLYDRTVGFCGVIRRLANH